MKKLRVAVIGLGFIGICHIEAIRRLGIADIVAVADSNPELGKAKACELSIDRFYADIDGLLAAEDIDVVHNCTPNHIHWQVNQRIIEADKHVMSEKPLGMNSQETANLLVLLVKHPKVAHAVNFNYRMNPLVQDMRHRIRQGEVGRPMLIHGSFLQDWLLYQTDYNWRIEQEYVGLSRAIADIGSHWMDTAQTILDDKITAVCADLVTVFPKRHKPLNNVKTFECNKSMSYKEFAVDTEDYGAVLFRTQKGVNGVFHVSQVSAGRKCSLKIEVDGTQSALYWDQENADKMWVGFRDTHNLEVMRNPSLINPAANKYTKLAAGHPEGWNDALKNNIYSFYQSILESKDYSKPTDFANFYDGHYLVLLTEAILLSSGERKWVELT